MTARQRRPANTIRIEELLREDPTESPETHNSLTRLRNAFDKCKRTVETAADIYRFEMDYRGRWFFQRIGKPNLHLANVGLRSVQILNMRLCSFGLLPIPIIQKIHDRHGRVIHKVDRTWLKRNRRTDD